MDQQRYCRRDCTRASVLLMEPCTPWLARKPWRSAPHSGAHHGTAGVSGQRPREIPGWKSNDAGRYQSHGSSPRRRHPSELRKSCLISHVPRSPTGTPFPGCPGPSRSRRLLPIRRPLAEENNNSRRRRWRRQPPRAKMHWASQCLFEDTQAPPRTRRLVR